MTTSPLLTLSIPAADAIFAINQAAKAAGPDAINGTIGIYMDEEGKPMMFPSVRAAIEDIRREITKRSYSYPVLTGLPEYSECVHKLLFGSESKILASIATTGGTGAVGINLRLAKMLQKEPTVIVSAPTWANHKQLCTEAGMKMAECPHVKDGKVTVDGMIEVMEKAASPALVLLHAGCHNPTGLDLSREQWEAVLAAIAKKNGIALIDFAYQGFGGEPEEDAWPVRRAAELGVTTLVCWSASKNHSIYSERTGLAGAIATDEVLKKTIEGHYMIITRKLHSAAATFGQSIVARVQSAHADAWRKDLADARAMMQRKRSALTMSLPKEFAASLAGNGMFAMLPLSPEQVDRLQVEQKVFLTRDGRVNIAGIPLKRIDELAAKIGKIWS